MKTKLKLIILFIGVFVASCATYYDHYTLTETVMTKVMVEDLLNKSTKPFSEHEQEVSNLQQQIQKMWLYEKTKDKNLIMQQMWGLLNNENSALQGFLTTWESQGIMSPVFVEEFKPEIIPLFDLMIDFESKKDKKAENALLEILNMALN